MSKHDKFGNFPQNDKSRRDESRQYQDEYQGRDDQEPADETLADEEGARGPGLSKEIKIGLAVIVVLVIALSTVLVMKWRRPAEETASAAADAKGASEGKAAGKEDSSAGTFAKSAKPREVAAQGGTSNAAKTGKSSGGLSDDWDFRAPRQESPTKASGAFMPPKANETMPKSPFGDRPGAGMAQSAPSQQSGPADNRTSPASRQDSPWTNSPAQPPRTGTAGAATTAGTAPTRPGFAQTGTAAQTKAGTGASQPFDPLAGDPNPLRNTGTGTGTGTANAAGAAAGTSGGDYPDFFNVSDNRTPTLAPGGQSSGGLPQPPGFNDRTNANPSSSPRMNDTVGRSGMGAGSGLDPRSSSAGGLTPGTLAPRYGASAGTQGSSTQFAGSGAGSSRTPQFDNTGAGGSGISLRGTPGLSGGAETGIRNDGLYTVQPGETFSSIADRLYNSDLYGQALAEHNKARVFNARQLKPGDKIEVPKLEELTRLYPSLCPRQDRVAAAERHTSMVSSPGKLGGGRQYVVQQGDNLYDIARYELGKASRWVEIYELNRDTIGKEFDYLTPGMKLTLPGDGSSAGTVTQKPNTGYYNR